MALGTVAEFLTSARVLLLDKVEPYRYGSDELVVALNLSLLEARRIRPEFFLHTPTQTPSYSTDDTSETVDFPEQYKVAILYYIVGHAQLRDEEDTQDARASVLLNKFVAQLTTVQA